MADDALVVKTAPERAWGGAREPNWREKGKRAVILLPADAYEVIRDLNTLSRRPIRDLNHQIFCAGMESLFGVSFQDLMGPYSVRASARIRLRQEKPMTHDALREFIEKAFVFEIEEEPSGTRDAG
jgi:hypothetical protein